MKKIIVLAYIMLAVSALSCSKNYREDNLIDTQFVEDNSTYSIMENNISAYFDKPEESQEKEYTEAETKKYYNPAMSFDYDEHENLIIDESYLVNQCIETQNEIEQIFGPAEFYITLQEDEEGRYYLSVLYNGDVAEFSDEELTQIKQFIIYEFKEITLSGINLLLW